MYYDAPLVNIEYAEATYKNALKPTSFFTTTLSAAPVSPSREAGSVWQLQSRKMPAAKDNRDFVFMSRSSII